MTPEELRHDAWRAWKATTFGSDYLIWHDGLNTFAVTLLVGEPRAAAIAMLRIGCEVGDSHAAEGLAEMGAAEALGDLRAALARAIHGAHRVRFALAIHQLVPDPALVAVLVAVLEREPSWSDRIDAAIGLRRFAGANDERALLAAVERDSEYLVRYHAAESLLARWHVEPADLAAHREIFADIVGPRGGQPITPADVARFAAARRALERLRPPS